VEFKDLGDVVEVLDNLRKPVSKDKREPGGIPYYGANGIQGYVKDYIFDGTYLLLGEDGSVINKDKSPVLNWAEGRIWVNNHAHVLGERAEVALLRYVYFYLSTVDISEVVRGTPPKINQANMRTIRIAVPPIEVQREIVRVLDTFTQLEAELEARRRQYQYYRDALLSYETDAEASRNGSKTQRKDVRWATLGEVGEFVRGRRFTKADYVEDGIGCIHYGEIYTRYGTSTTATASYVRSDMASTLRFTRPGDLVIAGVGETVEDVGKAVAWLGDGEVAIHDDCFAFRHSLNPKFVSYYFQTTRRFKRYHLFGFTGTPIFADNASTAGNPLRRTTAQAFGDKLHTYTIVDAINDKNVLPFRIDYINTIRASANIKDKKVSAIDTERALLAPERISQVVGYIREHFDQKTKRAATYKMHGKRLVGFNSLFATAGIDAARRYYAEFAAQQNELPEAQRLKIGLIYSFAANEEEVDGLLCEEEFETTGLDQSSRDFLDAAISDYNALFGTSFDTSADKFQNYYKDLSQRLRNRELDLVIVVNMFLTGFDATTLNTLWVDKNLKAHGLIQAYSRTNRILNSVKTYGNIISFRDLEQATNDALALFGNKDAKGIVLLKPYTDYYTEYQAKIDELQTLFPLGTAITGEAAQKCFIRLFGAILRLRNILTAFDDFAGDEILSQRDFQDFQSLYLNLYAEFRNAWDAEKESINDDVVFEIELIKQVEINVDYILMLVEQYLKKKGTGKDKEIRANIERAINASPSLRNKKDLIVQFVDTVSTKGKVDAQWQAFVVARKTEELERIIREENLHAEETRAFVDNAFRDGAIPTAGTAITRVLPPVSRFSKDNGHGLKKQTVLEKLAVFFERYFGLAP
jgi:hypothetical protein